MVMEEVNEKIVISGEELFHIMMDLYMVSRKLPNPHSAGEFIIKQIEELKQQSNG